MQFGNAAINILVFRWGALGRDYVPQRRPVGHAQNGGATGKSGGRARISLSPSEIPRGIGCRRMMGNDGGIDTAPYDRLPGPNRGWGVPISCAISTNPLPRRRCAWERWAMIHP